MRRKKVSKSILFLTILSSVFVISGCTAEKKPQVTENTLMEDTGDNLDEELLEEAGANVKDLGIFSVQDIEGNNYTQDMFADYDLTMVNVFTTWCSPCVNEIPDLEKLKNEMSDQGVNVIGIVLDSVDSYGNVNQDTIEKAKLLAETTGVTYPFLIPDTGYLNGRLAGIEAVPETFFVDRKGDIVGDTYSGSRTFEDWKSIVEAELKGVLE